MNGPPNHNNLTTTCGVCHQIGSEVQITGCGCTFHALCAPTSLIATTACRGGGHDDAGFFFECPSCRVGLVLRPELYLIPLDFQDLEKSIQLRKENKKNHHGGGPRGRGFDWEDDCSSSLSYYSSEQSISSKKHSRRDDGHEEDEEPSSSMDVADRAAAVDSAAAAAAAVYSRFTTLGSNLVVADDSSFSSCSLSTSNSNSDTNGPSRRTGRWTSAEVEYTDRLVASFDNGCLPLPSNVKLNQFLGDILMCKASRLSKKMKSAKLSSRSFQPVSSAGSAILQNQEDSGECLATLQHKFLEALPSEISRLEVRFNVSMQWQFYLLKLFQQEQQQNRHSPGVESYRMMLHASDWISSVEELEKRAGRAQRDLKAIQRRRNNFASLPCAKRPRRVSSTHLDENDLKLEIFDDEMTVPYRPHDLSSNNQDDLDHHLLDQLIGEHHPQAHNTSTSAALVEETSFGSSSDQDDSCEGSVRTVNGFSFSARHQGQTFLDMIALYMQEHKLPFQHASCWVPSMVRTTNVATFSTDDAQNSPNDPSSKVQLCHAGYISRNDVAPRTRKSMECFGENCSSLFFRPGKGLPGRVYLSGQAQWEHDLRVLDPVSDAHAAPALLHGIRTAAAVPLKCNGVSRMVLVLYSSTNVSVDLPSVYAMGKSLEQYSPKPTWQLVIGIKANVDFGEKDDHEDAVTLNDKTCPFDKKISQTLGETTNHIPFLTPLLKSGEDKGRRPLSPLMLLEEVSGKNNNEIDPILSRMVNLIERQTASTNSNILTAAEAFCLRLFLLTPSDKRSPSDSDSIETLKASFLDYSSRRHQRGDHDLYRLLLNDWSCLTSGIGHIQEAPQPSNLTAVSPSLSTSSSTTTINIPPNRKKHPSAMSSRHSAGALSRPPPMAHSDHFMAMARSRSLPKLEISSSSSTLQKRPATEAVRLLHYSMSLSDDGERRWPS